jgi:hypothetical protein
MVRAYAPLDTLAPGDITDYERTHILRHMPDAASRRYEELNAKRAKQALTAAERAEFQNLVAASEQLALENAGALLRHRDPAAYEALAPQTSGIVPAPRQETPLRRRAAR